MARIPKTVFISYRRTNQAHAIKIYQLLQESGYDPFLDIKDLGAGAWRVLIQREIQKRAHFMLLLTPSAVERFAQPNDVMRFEIETALDNKRNLVPLMFDGFSYSDPRIHDYLTGKLAILSEYNAYPINWRRLKKDIQELIDRFMSVHPDDVIHPDGVVGVVEEAKRDENRPSFGGVSLDSDEFAIPEPEFYDEEAGILPDWMQEDEESDFDERAESVDKLLEDVLADKEKKQAEIPPLPRLQPSAPMTRTASKKSAGGAGVGGAIMAILMMPVALVSVVYRAIQNLLNPRSSAIGGVPNERQSATPPAPKPVVPSPAPIPTEQPKPAIPPAEIPDFQSSPFGPPPQSTTTGQVPSEFDMTEADLLLMMRQAMANIPPITDDQLAQEEAEELES